MTADRRAAFITGGSSGIGLELALILAGRGHPVAIFARDAGRLQSAVDTLKRHVSDLEIAAYPVDVGDAGACRQAVAQANARFGAPGWAIANAGIAEPGEFLTQPLTAHETQMRINYMGALQFAHAVAPGMTEHGGRLVFVSSAAALFGIYGYGSYAPSKYAMRGLAEVLRVELAPHGIAVSLAYPPDTDTPMLKSEEGCKPAITREITAGGGVWQARDVAALILRKAEQGRFAITPGAQITALALLHSLIAPLLRFWQGRIVRKHLKRGRDGR